MLNAMAVRVIIEQHAGRDEEVPRFKHCVQARQDRATGISDRRDVFSQVDADLLHVKSHRRAARQADYQGHAAQYADLQQNQAADRPGTHSLSHEDAKLAGPFHDRHEKSVENAKPGCQVKDGDYDHATDIVSSDDFAHFRQQVSPV